MNVVKLMEQIRLSFALSATLSCTTSGPFSSGPFSGRTLRVLGYLLYSSLLLLLRRSRYLIYHNPCLLRFDFLVVILCHADLFESVALVETFSIFVRYLNVQVYSTNAGLWRGRHSGFEDLLKCISA